MERLTEKNHRILRSDNFDTKICLFASHWNPDDCKGAPRALFLFGDNDQKMGCGGQAVIRNCPNAMGIPTKKYPSNQQSSFYTDTEYMQNCEKISNAINGIIEASVNYDEIYFPYDGFGTGLAKLPEKAPKTLKFLEDMIDGCFGIQYPSIRKHGARLAVNTNDQ